MSRAWDNRPTEPTNLAAIEARRAEVRSASRPVDEGLDAAWREAEAALPEGWCDLAVYHYDPDPGDQHEPGHYGAKTMDPADGGRSAIYGYGTTPAAALRALAAALAAEPTPDRVCIHGVDHGEECPECGFGFVTEPALAAKPTPQAGLDVERLRDAIYAVSVRHDWEHTTDREDRTEEIAAEYAALSQPPEPEADEPILS